jgi:hypothetical protein
VGGGKACIHLCVGFDEIIGAVIQSAMGGRDIHSTEICGAGKKSAKVDPEGVAF